MKYTAQRNTMINHPFGSGENPIHLLTAAIQYLCAYTKALAREDTLPEEDAPVSVICISPNQFPYIDFSDRVNLLELKDYVTIIEEKDTGLMMACIEAELLAGDDGHYLIGPAVLFRCDDHGTMHPISSRDYQNARALYTNGLNMMDMGERHIPAIKIHPVSNPPKPCSNDIF